MLTFDIFILRVVALFKDGPSLTILLAELSRCFGAQLTFDICYHHLIDQETKRATPYIKP